MFLANAEKVLISTLERLGLAWWIEIVTDNPYCIYYFGPFATQKEAKFYKNGYLEDLAQEEALIIAIQIKQCKPKQLTLCEANK